MPTISERLAVIMKKISSDINNREKKVTGKERFILLVVETEEGRKRAGFHFSETGTISPWKISSESELPPDRKRNDNEIVIYSDLGSLEGLVEKRVTVVEMYKKKKLKIDAGLRDMVLMKGLL